MAITNRIKQKVGKATKPVLHEVEKGQIRRFALAIGEDNPIHTDEAVAQAAGYPSLVAPPTFVSALFDIKELYDELELDEQTTMHAEEEYEYFQTICAGDTVSVVHRVADVYDKDAPNGKLLFVIIETRGTDAKDNPVFKGRRVLVELKN